MLMYPKLKPLEEVNKDRKRILLKHIQNECINDYIKAQPNPDYFTFQKDYSIELSYENYSMNEALKILMKLDEKEVPSGFEIIGDIAHMNLNEKQFPFRYQVGQVVLDKNPKLCGLSKTFWLIHFLFCKINFLEHRSQWRKEIVLLIRFRSIQTS